MAAKFKRDMVNGIERSLKLYCDIKSTVLYFNNNKSSSKSKYIDIKFLVVKERIQNGEISIEYIRMNSMLADPLTKGFVPNVFHEYIAHTRITPTIFTPESEYVYYLSLERLNKAIVLDCSNVSPNLIKNAEAIEGAGGPGSIKKLTLAESDKQRIDGRIVDYQTQIARVESRIEDHQVQMNRVESRLDNNQAQMKLMLNQLQQLNSNFATSDSRVHTRPLRSPILTHSSESMSIGGARPEFNLSKSIRLEIPLFNANPRGIQGSFSWVADGWYGWRVVSVDVPQWNHSFMGRFGDCLHQRFGVSAFTNLKGVLSKLSQTDSLRDYIREFEALLNQVPGLDDDLYMSFFVSGLQPELRSAVQLRTPSTLHLAMQIALAYDDHHSELKSSFSVHQRKVFSKPFTQADPLPAPVHSKPVSQNSPATQPLALPAPSQMRRLSHEELQQKREQGLCYYCNEKWNGKHKCKHRFLLLIGDIDESDNDVEEEEIVWKPENDTTDIKDAALHAMGDHSFGHSLRFKIVFSHKEVSILIDSGSTQNFIQKQLALELQLSITKVKKLRVYLGNGEVLVIDRKCLNVPIELQGVQFSVDLWLLELSDLQIILGMPWLEKLGRVTHDYMRGSMEFVWHGKDVMLTGGKDEPLHSQTDTANAISTTICYAISQRSDSLEVTNSELLGIQNQVSSELWPVLLHFQSIFQVPHELPLFRGLNHAIHLLDKVPPVNVKPYRYAHCQKTEIEQQISDLLANGFIQHSQSPFSSLVLLVKKQDESWRMYELLDELGNASVFTKLDLRAGYHQIRVQPADVEKTTFRTHQGHYEFLVMPFGLTNAPATFQAVMNQLFKPYLRKFIIVFFDDILVFSKSLSDHIEHLRIALFHLQQHRFFVKLSKFQFGASSIDYLGHIVSKQGVQADPKKIAAMVSWLEPKSLKQSRGFLGLTGYYRRFVQGYASLAAPLTDLLKGGKDLPWSATVAQAFIQLKEKMANTPVLVLPDFKLPFVIETDASNSEIGVVLLQQDRPLAFFSQKLGSRMSNASTYVRELYAITVAVKRWRQYLLGSFFTIRTDHRSIKELLTQTIQTIEQQKYICKLMGYAFRIEYKAGSSNIVADALSRIHEEASVNALLSEPVFDILKEIKQQNTEDSYLLHCQQQVQNNSTDVSLLTVKDGIVFHKNRFLLSPKSLLIPGLIREAYASPVGGHASITRTFLRLSTNFYWTTMRADVKQYVSECSICQQVKYEANKPTRLLQPLPVPEGIFEDLSMDFIVGLPLSHGHCTILVVIHRLSKFAYFGRLPRSYTAAVVAHLFCELVVSNHGFPCSLLTDRDPVFMSQFWTQLFKLSGTQLRTTTAYHPQSDGQTEVTNRYLEQYLRAFCHEQPMQWSKFISWAQLHYNSSVHSAIAMTPYEAVYGRPPMMIPHYPRGLLKVEAVDSVLSQRNEILSRLKTHLERARNCMKVQADKHRRERTFQVHPTFHVSVLKPMRQSEGSVLPAVPLPLLAVDNKPVQEPLAVVAKRALHGNGQTQYQFLVQWTHSVPEDSTWENADDLQRCYPNLNLEDKVSFEDGGNVTKRSSTRVKAPPLKLQCCNNCFIEDSAFRETLEKISYEYKLVATLDGGFVKSTSKYYIWTTHKRVFEQWQRQSLSW
ncbi:uncharacterized protein LOC133312169 [Gastrolobium bilobum]|uniref:uncharacterized protein LOC133312169 n=1 Tax=Gastrolobium bilobum TaxID=150636 RepID=UPI002AB0DABB|nr:uncharacterized protein LOC133312169 [Gastrolobium bilobum]